MQDEKRLHPDLIQHPDRLPRRAARRAGLSLLLLGGLAAGPLADAQQREVPDTYTAVTANMSPAGIELKADVIRWSSAEERAAVIAALGAEEPATALRDLPTAGVVWRSGSAVGHAIKYAHRETAADGSETVTLVTDRQIGSTSFTPWTADDPVDTASDYSVLTLEIPAAGSGGRGTMSFGADIHVEADAGLVRLDAGARAPLLDNAVRQPKPYWARSD